MRYRHLFVGIGICLLMFTPRPSAAQSDAAVCETFKAQAISSFVDNCRDPESNTLCYGYADVLVTSRQSSLPLFSQPGDRITLDSIRKIQTSPLDLRFQKWGSALIKLPFSVSSTDTQPPVFTYMLMLGNTIVEDMASEQATLTPLQALLVQTDSTAPACPNMPSVFAVQTPENVTLKLTVNYADLELTGLALFQWQPHGKMAVIVSNGSVRVSGGPSARSGQTLLALMDRQTILGWAGAARSMNPAEEAVAGAVIEVLSRAGMPVTGTATPTATAQSTPSTCAASATHEVRAGETLFGIAQRYGVTVDEIVAANRIVDRNRIYPGQSLTIPCGKDRGAFPWHGGMPSLNQAGLTVNCGLALQVFSGLTPEMQALVRQVCGNP